jgi:hypothetical protein
VGQEQGFCSRGVPPPGPPRYRHDRRRYTMTSNSRVDMGAAAEFYATFHVEPRRSWFHVKQQSIAALQHRECSAS